MIPSFDTLWPQVDSIEGHLPLADAEGLYLACLLAMDGPYRATGCPFLEIGSFRGRS